MIARAPYLFLLLIIVPDLYLDIHYWRRRHTVWQRLLRWLPTIVLVAYTLFLTYEKSFIPDPPVIVYIYLLLLGLIAIPKLVYVLCSMTGLAVCRLLHRRINIGNLIGALCTPVIWFVVVYGSLVGFGQLEVNRTVFVAPDLPAAFDGYRLVLFSDAHVGTYTKNNQWILRQAIDSINAQRPDMIVFVGDLQNIHPQELYQHLDILSTLKAKDGVFSVLGNHDYAEYLACDDVTKVANCRETRSLEQQMGWTLLLNENRTIARGNDRITIAGMENDGDGKHFPQKGDIGRSLEGVADGTFVVMLEHDPSAWRRKIVPDGRAQLTLSGHTHAMQLKLFGWCPLSLTGKEVNGWYQEGRQSLFVTAGLGALVPFRFGATGEIVVITLKKGRR